MIEDHIAQSPSKPAFLITAPSLFAPAVDAVEATEVVVVEVAVAAAEVVGRFCKALKTLRYPFPPQNEFLSPVHVELQERHAEHVGRLSSHFTRFCRHAEQPPKPRERRDKSVGRVRAFLGRRAIVWAPMTARMLSSYPLVEIHRQ